MFSKIIDKSTIISDLKRFWWISAGYMAVMAFFILPHCVYYAPFSSNLSTDEGAIAFIAALLTAGLLFSYLHKGSAVSCLHGMPVTRRQLFFSHYISGIIILIVPMIISCAVMAAEIVYYKSIGADLRFLYVAKYFYAGCIYAAVAFSITVFAAMITGNTPAAYVFSGVFVLVPFYLVSSIQYILEENLYGYCYNISDMLEKIYVLTMDEIWSCKSIYYIVLAIALTALSYLLYKVRRLEYYDEIIAFPQLKPVFTYCTAVCFGFLGYMLLGCIGVLPLALISICAANMINKKSFTFKGILKPIIVFTASAAVFSAVIAFDLTGFETRVPSVDDVESVRLVEGDYWGSITGSVSINGVTSDGRDINDKKYYELYPPVSSDKADIEAVNALHAAVGSKNFEAYGDKYTKNVYIEYNLKNGKTAKREYVLDYDALLSKQADAARQYVESDLYKDLNFLFADDSKKTVESISLDVCSPSSKFVLSKTDYDELMQQLKKDVEEFDAYDIKANDLHVTNGYRLIISYSKYKIIDGVTYSTSVEDTVDLNGGYKNTMAFLKNEMPKYSEYTADKKDITDAYISVHNNPDNEYLPVNAEYIGDTSTAAEIYSTVINGNISDLNFDSKSLYYIDICFNGGDLSNDENYDYDSENGYVYYNVATTDLYDDYGSDSKFSAHLVLPYDRIPRVLKPYIK